MQTSCTELTLRFQWPATISDDDRDKLLLMQSTNELQWLPLFAKNKGNYVFYKLAISFFDLFNWKHSNCKRAVCSWLVFSPARAVCSRDIQGFRDVLTLELHKALLPKNSYTQRSQSYDQSTSTLKLNKLILCSKILSKYTEIDRIPGIFSWRNFMPFQSWSIPEASNAPAAHSVLQAKRPVDYKIVVLRVE